MTWGGALAVVATHKPTGNALAAAVGHEQGDAHSFDNARELKRVSGVGADTAWFVGTLATMETVTVAADYAAGGTPQVLLDRGLLPQQIADAREIVKVLAGGVDEVTAGAPGFVSGLGYEPADGRPL